MQGHCFVRNVGLCVSRKDDKHLLRIIIIIIIISSSSSSSTMHIVCRGWTYRYVKFSVKGIKRKRSPVAGIPHRASKPNSENSSQGRKAQ
jgi:hypothetical protein